MADLKNGQVEVDVDSNERIYGPAGTRKRSEASCFLRVGGSSNAYKVTINHKTGNWCDSHTGNPCPGNLGGKRKYGHPSKRDVNNPVHWCKHVRAAMDRPDLIAEAQEISHQAFHPVAVPGTPEPPSSNVRERLARLEEEKAELTRVAAEDIREHLRGLRVEWLAKLEELDKLTA